MTNRDRLTALLRLIRPRSRASGGLVAPRRPTDEPAGIISPAMHFDSREDMERYIFGREPEDRA